MRNYSNCNRPSVDVCAVCVHTRANSLNKAVDNDDSFNYTFLDCYLHTKKKKTFAFPIVYVHKDLPSYSVRRISFQIPRCMFRALGQKNVQTGIDSIYMCTRTESHPFPSIQSAVVYLSKHESNRSRPPSSQRVYTATTL